MNAHRKKVILTDIILLVIIAAVIGVSMIWSRTIEEKFGLSYYAEVEVDDDTGSDSDGDDEIDTSEFAEMYVHFVDVGQGDCTIIEFPDGKTMIIDGGENNDKVESAIDKFINNTLPQDFKYFDYAILTHADSDHCGSLDYVLNKYPARFVYRPNVEAVGTSANPYDDPGKADLTSDARSKNTAVYANAVKSMYYKSADMNSVVYITDPADESQTISGGAGDDKYTFTFYTPLSTKYTGDGEWNNYSPIMILEYRGFKFAMSGDAEEKNLGEFATKVQAAKTDGVTDKYDVFTDTYSVNVIKAGHHGSRNATTPDYLDILTTETGARSLYTVISCGAGNSYKHPHAEALARYNAIGVKDENILRTDKAGDITFAVRVNEQGVYNLFYGDKATAKRNVKLVFTYKKLGNIELKWAVVAWSVFAIIVVVAIVHMIVFCGERTGGNGGNDKINNDRSRGGGKRGGGRKR